MNGRFKEHIREIYRKTSIRIKIVLPALIRAAAGIINEMGQIVLPCAAALIVCALLKKIGAVSALVELIELLLLMPAACAMLTYAADAGWERRNITLKDAGHLVRIRAKQIFITGLAAWLIVMVLRGIVSMMLSMFVVLLGGIFALLSMIPLIGVVFSAIGTAAQWLLALFVEYACHAALTVGMLALTADGISGKAQLDHAVNVLKNGGKKFWEALVLLFGVWVAVGCISQLLSLALPAAGSIVMPVLNVCSMIALSVVYLQRRDGIDFR